VGHRHVGKPLRSGVHKSRREQTKQQEIGVAFDPNVHQDSTLHSREDGGVWGDSFLTKMPMSPTPETLVNAAFTLSRTRLSFMPEGSSSSFGTPAEISESHSSFSERLSPADRHQTNRLGFRRALRK